MQRESKNRRGERKVKVSERERGERESESRGMTCARGTKTYLVVDQVINNNTREGRKESWLVAKRRQGVKWCLFLQENNEKMDKKSKSHCPVDDEQDVLECRPIKSLQELLEWEPGTIEGIRAESLTVPLEKHETLPNATSSAKVLVCHDMKGGYHDDDR